MPRGTTPAPPTNIYPRPPRGGRHRQHLPWRTDQDFYPRPPRGGRPVLPLVRSRACSNFYPRPPRGGRLETIADLLLMFDFYPRPPRGGRPVITGRYGDMEQISIHALREEGDEVIAFSYAILQEFLSTPSARRATRVLQAQDQAVRISIHALREEGDQNSCRASISLLVFLSTPSARRATRITPRLPPRLSNFYPRPPRGGRPQAPALQCAAASISIHALREEGDRSRT